jgi:hypothetical protein
MKPSSLQTESDTQDETISITSEEGKKCTVPDERRDNAKKEAIMGYSAWRLLSGMGGTQMKTFTQLLNGRSSAVLILTDRKDSRTFSGPSGLVRWVSSITLLDPS